MDCSTKYAEHYYDLIKKVKVTGVYASIIFKNEEIWTVQKVTLKKFYESVFY
jgi:hypothetical protein